MLPALTRFGLLPPGEHIAGMPAIRGRFGATPHRARLLATLETLIVPTFAALGFTGDYLLDGSFVTQQPVPGDLDIVLDAYGQTDMVFTAAARCVMAQHDTWHAHQHLDVHIRHPRIRKDMGEFFQRVSEQYSARYDVPAGALKGLVRWTP